MRPISIEETQRILSKILLVQEELRQEIGEGKTEAQKTPYCKESKDISCSPSEHRKAEHLERYDGSPHTKFGMATSAKMHWSSTYGDRGRRFKLSWDKNTSAFP